MGTSIDRASSVKDLYQRASAYGVPRRDVNGMDIVAVRNALGEAIDRARKEKRPTLIEAETYRYRGHSMSDPGKYRTKEEVEQMMKSDPILLFGRRLMEQERFTQADLDAIDKDVLAQMDDAVAFTEQSPDPPAESLYEDVYVRSPYIHLKTAEKDPAWRAAIREDRVPEKLPPWTPPAPPAEAPAARPRKRPPRREGQVAMALITMREALNQALKEEMTRDPNVFILGEEVGAYQGAYKITQGLLAQFGEWRVRDTPIAEEAIAGVAVGAAFIGLRPIAEMMTFNFSLLALDMIVNHAAKYRYMSGGQIRCPMVMRGPSRRGHAGGGPALPGLRELVRPHARAWWW